MNICVCILCVLRKPLSLSEVNLMISHVVGDYPAPREYLCLIRYTPTTSLKVDCELIVYVRTRVLLVIAYLLAAIAVMAKVRAGLRIVNT